MPASCSSSRTTSPRRRSETRNAAAVCRIALVASSETTTRRSPAIDRTPRAAAAWSGKTRAAATAAAPRGKGGRTLRGGHGEEGRGHLRRRRGSAQRCVEARHFDLVVRGAHVVDRPQRRRVEAAALVATQQAEAVRRGQLVPGVLERDGT